MREREVHTSKVLPERFEGNQIRRTINDTKRRLSGMQLELHGATRHIQIKAK
jgi:hypothetical protein